MAVWSAPSRRKEHINANVSAKLCLRLAVDLELDASSYIEIPSKIHTLPTESRDDVIDMLLLRVLACCALHRLLTTTGSASIDALTILILPSRRLESSPLTQMRFALDIVVRQCMLLSLSQRRDAMISKIQQYEQIHPISELIFDLRRFAILREQLSSKGSTSSTSDTHQHQYQVFYPGFGQKLSSLLDLVSGTSASLSQGNRSIWLPVPVSAPARRDKNNGVSSKRSRNIDQAGSTQTKTGMLNKPESVVEKSISSFSTKELDCKSLSCNGLTNTPTEAKKDADSTSNDIHDSRYLSQATGSVTMTKDDMEVSHVIQATAGPSNMKKRRRFDINLEDAELFLGFVNQKPTPNDNATTEAINANEMEGNVPVNFGLVCEVCNRGFGCKSHLEVHVRLVHKNERPYECHLCDKNRGPRPRFGRRGDLNRHIESVHLQARKHVCTLCNLTFSRKFTLNRHKKNKHPK